MLPAAAQDAGAGGPSDAGPDAGRSPFFLPGTQPGELTLDLRSPELCKNCHGVYADYSANESWKGTMMANAARDPLFQAALTIANQDVPGSGDLCIRCHAPRAWLFGRSNPPRLSNLEPDDYESVQCDFCHRLVPRDPLLIGSGQYTVADDFIRRGPLDDAESAHDWQYSPYHESSELCGLCHDVSNPAQGGFAIERTYTEWKNSDYSVEGRTCQSCHMPEHPGKVAGNPAARDRIAHVHELAGGNAWMPLVLAGEFPELERQDAYERTAQNAIRMLQSSAELSIEAPDRVEPGRKLELSVRVENLTGHKLPTGYPEGRLCWLELEVRDEAGAVWLHSGAYEGLMAEREEDAQLRTYEVKMAADGEEGFHFVLQNELLQDNRIPPRGFRPTADTWPVGRSYPVVSEDDDGPVLAHWDVAPYSVEVPEEVNGKVMITARLWYQTAAREYVEFLRDGNQSDDRGERLYQLWDKYDRSPPVEMASVRVTIDAAGAEPDAGIVGESPDASISTQTDAGAALDEATKDGGPNAVKADTGSERCSDLDANSDQCDTPGAAEEHSSESGCACRTRGAREGTYRDATFLSLLVLLVTYWRRRDSWFCE